MRKLILFGIACMALSCSSQKTEVRYTHQIIVTFTDGTKDTLDFHSKLVKEEEHYTETGCVITMIGGTLYVKGAEETGLSRNGVRKYDHKIMDTKETIIKN